MLSKYMVLAYTFDEEFNCTNLNIKKSTKPKGVILFTVKFKWHWQLMQTPAKQEICSISILMQVHAYNRYNVLMMVMRNLGI